MGLGARCAGVPRTDPGAEIGDGPPHAKVRIDGHPISLWSVLDQRRRRRLRPVGLRRGGARPLAVAGAAAGVGGAAAQGRVDPDRHRRPGSRADRPAVRGQSARLVRSARPLGSRGAHRPPHPLGPVRRHRAARPTLVRRAHEQGIDVLGLTDHDTTEGWARGGRRRRAARRDAGARDRGELHVRGPRRAPARLPPRPDLPAARRRAAPGARRPQLPAARPPSSGSAPSASTSTSTTYAGSPASTAAHGPSARRGRPRRAGGGAPTATRPSTATSGRRDRPTSTATPPTWRR